MIIIKVGCLSRVIICCVIWSRCDLFKLKKLQVDAGHSESLFLEDMSSNNVEDEAQHKNLQENPELKLNIKLNQTDDFIEAVIVIILAISLMNTE